MKEIIVDAQDSALATEKAIKWGLVVRDADGRLQPGPNWNPQPGPNAHLGAVAE